MKNLLLFFVTFVTSHFIYRSAFAWQIMTPASESCHENIILAAFGETKLSSTTAKLGEITELKADILNQIREMGVPASLENRKFMEEIVDQFDLRDRSPEEIWFYASLIAGVRFPDTRGFATFKAHESRMTHLSNSNQSIHTLRSKDDDGEQGDAKALSATQKLILQNVRWSHEQWRHPSHESRKVYSTWTFPFYGDNVRVLVHAPIYTLAMGAHSIQDSYAHTLRNEAWEVVSVANFVDLISGRRDAKRDGPGHSDRLDECKLHTTFDRERFQKAVDATTDFALATYASWKQETFRPEVIEKVLSEIYKFRPGCTDENAYCQSPWLPFANEQITTALRLKPECGVIGSRLNSDKNLPTKTSRGVSFFSFGLLLLPLLAAFFSTSFKRIIFFLTLISTLPGKAETLQKEEPDRSDWQNFVLTEEAFYNPERIWINGSLGVSYRLKGQKRFSAVSQLGYRLNRSGPYLHLEYSRIHNFASVQHLLSISNVGIGYENLWLLGRLRTSLAMGTSILNLKTEVDTAGTWGYFLDIRPVDIRTGLKNGLVFWFAPITFNLSIPVPNGIPLTLIHHQITTGVEKTF